MEENISALYSEYVIDGAPRELSPAMMLDSCLVSRRAGGEDPVEDFAPVVDESIDPGLSPVVTDSSEVMRYLSLVREAGARKIPAAFAGCCTRASIARALVDAIWKRGHFRLGDLTVSPEWHWPVSHIGDMAAFYESVSAAADYTDSLGLKMSDYSFTQSAGDASLGVGVSLLEYAGCPEDELLAEIPFRTEDPHMEDSPMHPSTLVPDAQSWIIYVPFDDCDYRLAGSMLAQVLGGGGPVAPQIEDADYFIDCYEVVRELVEDGIILSGTTVGDGGLITAVKNMTGPQVGASVELADLVRATGEKDIVRLLFSEVPGAVFQIADIDYDYVDAELLLQDVAFYPLGHPLPGTSEVRVSASEKSGVQAILESVIRSQNSEGED